VEVTHDTGDDSAVNPDMVALMAGMDAETAAHPQEMYKMIREGSPVLRVGTAVMVASRAGIDEVFRCPEIFSSNMDAVDLGNVRPMIPLQIDPPRHINYRRILDPLFAPRQMAVMEPAVAKLVHDLIDGFIGLGEVNLTDAFTIPLPSQVFLTLLGLPLSDLKTFLRIKDGLIRPHIDNPAAKTPEQQQQVRIDTAQETYAYFEKTLDEREVEPRDDLLSRFLVTEVDGVKLTRHEILDICFLFLIAGLDTVSASLECFFAYLAQHPEQRRELADNPAIVPHAVEELLRWESPVAGVPRVAVADYEVGGEKINIGDQVFCMIGAGNTDDTEFPDAHRVEFDREANRHIAFGGGIHRCLGSHLARMELRVALREFHSRIPDYELVPGAQLSYTPGIRSIADLPIRWAV
jgi:cytochrome P450